MNHNPIAKIISWNAMGEEVCASAARISTTEGSALDLFESAKENKKNAGLIGKVLRSGHKSLIEHMVFTIAMQDVSVYVEQYFIEMRLASFTVKSRRYVDFGGLGYHIPKDLKGENLEAYKRHMNGLFEGYRKLLDLGIPKEDARFVLPYSFCSNFYCTINARELLGVIRSIRCGRGRMSPELLDIAQQLTDQATALFPALAQKIPDVSEDIPGLSDYGANDSQEPQWIKQNRIGHVEMPFYPRNPITQLRSGYAFAHPWEFPKTSADEIEEIVFSLRPRELEQLSYGFVVSNITLAGLTHLTRHRMQSPIIPPIESVDLGSFIIPDTIANNSGALSIYQQTLEDAYHSAIALCRLKVFCPYRGCFAVAGNVMTVMTTMNARELKTFIQLRSCNRAQWEIRQVAINMLSHLRNHYPQLFNLYGPSCYLTGVCPEGKMCCGKAEETKARFTA